MKLINNITIYSAIIFMVCLMVTGCDDFLTQTNPSEVTLTNYYTKPEHIASTINAAYADMRGVYDGGGFGGAAWLMLEMPTGFANNVALGAGGQKNPPILNLTNNADNIYMVTWWNSHYRGIANANVAIEKIPDVSMEEDLARRYMGEARFIRAYYYFNLVRIFGDIPLIDEPIDFSSEQLFAGRASVADVYNLIVEDLEAAEISGLTWEDNSGHVSLGAVKTLLANVYLTMAGYPLQAGSEYYELAKNTAADIIASDKFYLFDSYADLRNKNTENMGEQIFMVQYEQDISNRLAFQQLFTPFGSNISSSGDDTGQLFPQLEFVASYDPLDKRIQEKQFYYQNYTLSSDRSVTIEFDPHIYKWFDPVAITETGRSGLNWPLLRYAEVLFIYAEAENEISGPIQSGYEAVNAIRRRAEIQELSGLNQEELREAIWKEKLHEMCWENKTWFDMVRLRKAFNPISGEFEDFVGHKFVYGPTLSEKELLFPIPDREILNNPNLTQNPGY